MNAMKVGAFDDTANSGKQLELRVGQCLLKLTDRQERSLKLENAVILEEFSHLQLPQPSWMAREGVPTGATHHKVSTLEEINVKTVEGACAWKANVPTPIDLNRFAGRKKKGGGGILLYVQKDVDISDEQKDQCEDLESVSVTLTTGVRYVIVYRPPGPHMSTKASDIIRKNVEDYDNVIIMGDLNMNMDAKSPCPRELRNLLQVELRMDQKVTFVTRRKRNRGTIIDHVWSKMPCKCSPQ